MADKVSGVLYNESDADIPRNRTGRALFFIGSVVLASLIPGLIGGWLLGYIPASGTGTLGFILGAIGGQLAFANVAPLYFVIVPQAQAFVTLNDWMALFNVKGNPINVEGNPNNTFGPGKSLEWPWVTRSRRSNLSLQVITISFTEEVPGKDTQLKVKGSYQFKVDILNASKFVGIDESTIRGGAIDLILSEISQTLSGESADEAKGNIQNFNDKLGERFGVGGKDPNSTAPEVAEFENRYGISSVAVTITGIDLPEDVQKTRDAIDESAQAVRSVAAMFGMTPEELKAKLKDGKISLENYIEMLDRTLAQGGASSMSIQALKFGGLEALAAAIAGKFGQGGK